jgi:hypothetical protein
MLPFRIERFIAEGVVAVVLSSWRSMPALLACYASDGRKRTAMCKVWDAATHRVIETADAIVDERLALGITSIPGHPRLKLRLLRTTFLAEPVVGEAAGAGNEAAASGGAPSLAGDVDASTDDDNEHQHTARLPTPGSCQHLRLVAVQASCQPLHLATVAQCRRLRGGGERYKMLTQPPVRKVQTVQTTPGWGGKCERKCGFLCSRVPRQPGACCTWQ